jgi:hypothetical protein
MGKPLEDKDSRLLDTKPCLYGISGVVTAESFMYKLRWAGLCSKHAQMHRNRHLKRGEEGPLSLVAALMVNRGSFKRKQITFSI